MTIDLSPSSDIDLNDLKKDIYCLNLLSKPKFPRESKRAHNNVYFISLLGRASELMHAKYINKRKGACPFISTH